MNEIEQAKKILEAPLREKGYDLYDLKFKGGKDASLEVVVDRSEPIGLDEIVELSGYLSDLLDENDPIGVAYTLDVSSAGAEKKIDLARLGEYLGRYVHLHLTHPYKGENILEGTLASCDEENITLEIRVKTRNVAASFPRKDCDFARLAIQF